MTTQEQVNEFCRWLKQARQGLTTLHAFTLRVMAEFDLQYGEAWQMVNQWSEATTDAEKRR